MSLPLTQYIHILHKKKTRNNTFYLIFNSLASKAGDDKNTAQSTVLWL